MRIFIMTLFPEMIRSVTSESIIGRAVDSGRVSIEIYNIRDYTNSKHGKVDDYPYGGGAGMVMQAQPIYDCYLAIKEKIGHQCPVIYLSPQGKVFTQTKVKELALLDEIVLLCGHYEGIDERVIEEIVTEEISIGDYVLTGGELPAMVLTDAIARLIPGVLHNEDSPKGESFEDGLLEYPQYSRPMEWNGRKVPEILLSGNHAAVDAWRLEQSKLRTKSRRPDLLDES